MKRIVLLSSLIIANGVGPAFANGFALEQQNAKAVGSAYAGAQAQFGDAGFAYYNPAAIAGVDTIQASFSIAGLIPGARYHDASGTLLGAFPVSGRASDDGALADAIVPNISAAFPLSDKLSIGLVVNAPFGLNTKYAEDSIVRYHSIIADIKVASITPIMGLELAPGFSVGGGVRIQYMDLEASAAIDAAGIALASGLPGFIPGTSDAQIAIDGDDLAIGFTLGFQVQPHEKIRIGASYASKISHDLSGDANFDISDSIAGQTINMLTGMFAPTRFASEFVTPASVSVGAAFDASDDLTLMTSAVFTRWSDFDTLTTVFATPTQPPDIFPQNWNDSWSVSVGGEYKVTRSVRVRAGLMYDESPVNDEFASPRIPDADRYWINAGASYDVNERLSIDGGFGFVFLEDRQINLSAANPENLFRGDLTANYETTGFVVSARLNYRFPR